VLGVGTGVGATSWPRTTETPITAAARTAAPKTSLRNRSVPLGNRFALARRDKQPLGPHANIKRLRSLLDSYLERFARDFPQLLKERGSKGTVRITQIGGSNEREVTVVPEVRLRVGGFETLLRPANIFSKPVGNDSYHGNFGMDLLSQAAEVTIDFQSMSLALR
jgi:hypothetical protein